MPNSHVHTVTPHDRPPAPSQQQEAAVWDILLIVTAHGLRTWLLKNCKELISRRVSGSKYNKQDVEPEADSATPYRQRPYSLRLLTVTFLGHVAVCTVTTRTRHRETMYSLKKCVVACEHVLNNKRTFSWSGCLTHMYTLLLDMTGLPPPHSNKIK